MEKFSSSLREQPLTHDWVTLYIKIMKKLVGKKKNVSEVVSANKTEPTLIIFDS